MKLTRRQLASAVALAAAPLSASPQTEDLDAAAHTRLKNITEALNTVPVPMSTEPAFAFRTM